MARPQRPGRGELPAGGRILTRMRLPLLSFPGRSPRVAIVLLCAALALGGCSLRLAYSQLDWLVPWYVRYLLYPYDAAADFQFVDPVGRRLPSTTNRDPNCQHHTKRPPVQ